MPSSSRTGGLAIDAQLTEAATGLHAYSADQPLILLTDYPADAPGGGAVILRSLLKAGDRERIVWLSPSEGEGSITLKAGSGGRGKRSLGRDQTVYARALADEVSAIARDRQARAAWVVMHGAGVAIGSRLIRAGKLPVHLTVHDDPAYANALRSRRYLPLVPFIARDFGYCLRNARSVDVIGPRMAAFYRGKYGIKPAVVHRALPGPIEPSPTYDKAKHGLRVGVLGSTYSYNPLPILAKAVASAAKSFGVAGKVRVIGKSHGDRLRDEVGDRVEVEVVGHVDEAEGVRLLRECFALYLNYPFGRLDATLRRTSFPTKLGTYAMAARPVLVHAPVDSSVMNLMNIAGYTKHWISPRVEEGTGILARLWDEPESSESHHDQAEIARRRYFDPVVNRLAIFGALNDLVEGASP